MNSYITFLPMYLREYANKFSSEGDVLTTHQIRNGNDITHVAHSLPMVLDDAAAEIEILRTKVEGLEYVERLIELAQVRDKR